MSDDSYVEGMAREFEQTVFDVDAAEAELPAPFSPQIIEAMKQSDVFLPEGTSVSSSVAQGLRFAIRASCKDADKFEPALAFDPGDLSVRGGGQRIGLTAPSLDSVWFLHVGLTVLPPWSYTDRGSWYAQQEKSAGILALLAPLIEKMGGVSVAKCPRNASDISSNGNNGIDVIKEARYENFYLGLGGVSWPSRGPCGFTAAGAHYGSADFDLCGYIAFPVGPIEAMRTIFLVVEDINEKMVASAEWSRRSNCVECPSSGINGLMAPLAEDDSGYGLPISRQCSMERSPYIEYPAVDFAGLPMHKAHQWLRYYFKSTDCFPVPGKFIGIAVKPQALLPWFFQRTSPVLYSGHFFETKSYTSGVVVDVVGSSEKLYGEVGDVYGVLIRGVTVYIMASDFYEYALGEEVAVLKKVNPHPLGSPFTWMDLDDIQILSDSLKEQYPGARYVLFRDYQIVPVSFYKEQQ